MARPPRAKQKALDAYERLLIEEGDRGATIAAVAEKSGISKGGVLYHFPSKESLIEGMCERVRALAIDDLAEMTAAGENRIDIFLRTSLAAGTPFDDALIALTRVAQSTDDDATQTLDHVRQMWSDWLRPSCRDQESLDLVLLVSDGLWHNNVQGDHSAIPKGDAFDRLIERVVSLTSR